MRAEAGFLALTLGFWLAGAGVLLASGIVTLSWRSLLAWGGPAYLVGLSLAGVVLTTLAIAGVRASTARTGLLLVVIAGAGVVAWRLLRPAPLGPGVEGPRDRGFLWAGAAVAALFVFAGTALALVQPINEWDGWAIWGLKAALLYDDGKVPDLLATGDYGLAHPDYPVLWPVLEATHQRGMGGVQPKLAALPYWTLYVAFAWTVAAVGSRLTRPAIWVPVAVGTLTTYAIVEQLFWHYADVPTAILVGAGALFGGLWLSGQGARWLVPAAIVLGAAVNGKNEGLVAVVALFAGLAAASLTGPRRLTALVPAAAFVGLSLLPWRLWLSAHDVQPDIKTSSFVDVGLLADRSDRVEAAASKLWDEISNESRWGYIAAVALVLIVVAVVQRSTRFIGIYYGVSVGLVFLFLLLAYWVTDAAFEWRLGTSGDRVVQLLGFLGIAAILQLAATLFRPEPEP